MDQIKIEQILVGPFEENCFIVYTAPNCAVIIDPGYDAGKIAAFMKKENVVPCAYLLTHGHIDHVSAVADLCDQWKAPILISKSDLGWAFALANAMPPYYPAPRKPTSVIRTLSDGETINDYDLEFQAISTPGHTEGSMCFFFKKEGILFTGDTLFAGSVGRTDFPGGDSKMLSKSLALLKKLPESTRIFPGHGPASDIKTEKETNYFMQILR